jgi:hypothetical protein
LHGSMLEPCSAGRKTEKLFRTVGGLGMAMAKGTGHPARWGSRAPTARTLRGGCRALGTLSQAGLFVPLF